MSNEKERRAWALRCEAEDYARRNQPVNEIEAACWYLEGSVCREQCSCLPCGWKRTVIAAARRVERLEAALRVMASTHGNPCAKQNCVALVLARNALAEGGGPSSKDEINDGGEG